MTTLRDYLADLDDRMLSMECLGLTLVMVTKGSPHVIGLNMTPEQSKKLLDIVMEEHWPEPILNTMARPQ